MIDKAILKLSKKHLLIIGGSKTERHDLIDKIINQANLEFFRFPKGMNSIDEYIDFVRKENLYHAWYTQKGKFGSNQLLDFHRDWISENNSLIIMEEVQEMEHRWKIDLLGTYIEQIQNRKKEDKTIRFVISQENEDGLINNLIENVYAVEGERRTKRQIIEGSIELITIDEK
jgi:hypothetical protein